MGVLPAALLCFFAGLAVVCLMWPGGRGGQLGLKCFLSVGTGLGIFSLTFFLGLLLSMVRTGLVAIDVAVPVLLWGALLVVRRGREIDQRAKSISRQTDGGRTSWILAVSFVISVLACSYGLVQRLLVNPQGGGWDAFAIWNLHARFLFLGGEHWRDGFTNLIPWSHPDYPLLVPASVAHFWLYLGGDGPVVPAAIAFIFVLASAGLLVTGLFILKGRDQAYLGGIVLLGTPFLLEHGVSQYVDVALGYFFLATVVLVAFYKATNRGGLLVLAGVMAGFAAWTKNEGQLFACAFLLAFAAASCRDEGGQVCVSNTSRVLAGMIPILLAIMYFKMRIAPSGDLFRGGESMLMKAADPHRYWMITRWFVKEFFEFGHWFVIPGTVLVIAYGWLMRRQTSAGRESGSSISALTLALTAAGYFAIFVITPYDLRWHLQYSLNRLFLQLWPSVLFLIFLKIPTPQEAENAGQVSVSAGE